VKLLAIAAVLIGLTAGDAAPSAEITMPGRLYSPGSLDVLVGTTVTWRNQDATTHTVTADNDSFDSGFIGPGGTYARLFSQPGVYAFHCTIHRFMRGVVRVYSLVLTGPDHPVEAGARVVLTGRAPPGSAAVTLESTTGKRWHAVLQKTLPADGTFVFRTVASAPARYRARVSRTASPVVPVNVAPIVSAERSGGAIRVATRPARPGSTAVLQAYDREHFAFVAVAQTRLDTRGTALLRLPRAGPAHVRVLVDGRSGWSAATSRVLFVSR
jgi:plastocyanin